MTPPMLSQLALGLLLLGVVGTGAELLLLEHFDGWQQLVPLVLLGLAVLATGAVLLNRGPMALKGFRLLMVLFVVSGALGVWFHYAGNAEFELEMAPDAAGWTLFREAMMGATPALAPATMIWFGLLGLLATWRYPMRFPPASRQPTP